jgi:metal-sulfur cluster biosynthetic enzyme
LNTFTESVLLEALQQCFVPALRSDVVTARLVRSATLERDADAPGAGIPGVPHRWIARITLAAPSSEDSVIAQLRAAVENRLLGLEAISRVELTISPPLFSILSSR